MEAVAQRTLRGRDPAASVDIGEPTATGA
jgi:hypothetical protein